MDIETLQRSMDDFMASDSDLAPLAHRGAIKLRMEPGARAASAKLAMICVSAEARAQGLSPSPGRRVMERLCAVCSEEGIDLELFARPLPMEPLPGGPPALISLDKLCAFYESFGFEASPGQSSRFSRKMSRPARPRPAPAKAARP